MIKMLKNKLAFVKLIKIKSKKTDESQKKASETVNKVIGYSARPIFNSIRKSAEIRYSGKNNSYYFYKANCKNKVLNSGLNKDCD